MNGSDPKQIARELLEEAHPALIGLSHWIHANPELGYQEVLASGWVTEWLTTAGFDVRTGVAGMPTAVVGSYGPGPFHVAVCVEYDALPAVGHACGHNVIAAAGVGAGLALAAVAEQLGLRVTVLGTPAEETGGGKVGLIKAGELDGVHAAMMVHPWPQDEATPSILAIRSLNVSYTGKEAHAAGFPYMGVNAADALVVAQTAIALLRQQLRSTDRVHGIVTKGGDAANIIPARTEAQWMVRGTSVARLDELTALVRRCFEAGALATGATLHIQEEICYADVRHDADLARLYQGNAEQLGRTVHPGGMPVSTDMGNVSYVVPTIHPMIGIEAHGAVNHQADFAAACATPSADQAIFDGALAMAWTAIDAVQDVALRERLMAFVPDAAEVAMISQAWMMPPHALALAAPATPAGVEAVDADGDGVPDPIIEAGLDPDARWADARDTVAVSALTQGGPDGGASAEPVAEDAWATEAVADRAEPADGVEAPAAAAIAFEGATDGWATDAIAALEPVAEPVVSEGTDAAEPGADPAAVTAQEAAAGPETAVDEWTAAGWITDPAPLMGERAPMTAAAVTEATDATHPDAEMDQDAAWARDVEAVAQQIAAAGLMARAEPTAEPASEPDVADAAPDDVLFVGFEDTTPDPVAEVVLVDAAEAPEAPPIMAAADPAPIADAWVAPQVPGESTETPGAVVAAAEAPGSSAVVADTALTEAQPADAWFATEAPAPVAPSPVAASAPAPVAPPAVAAPAPAAAAVPMDRDAWERAFEAAATRIGWDEQFDAAVRERMTDEGMDRSEAIEDLASDLGVAGATGEGWPPQASELVSREHIEAEGFSFVAPDLSPHREELRDVWSRNGVDHAAEDLRLG